MRRPTVSDATHLFIRVDSVLPEVGQATSLLDEGGWETVSEGLVVDELRAHVVPQLENCQQASTGSDTATYVILKTIGQ